MNKLTDISFGEFNRQILCLLNLCLFILIPFAPLSAQNYKYAYEQYTSESGLPHSRISSIAFDKDNLMYLATNSGLYTFDGNRFLREEAIDNSIGILDIVFDSNGLLWMRFDVHERHKHLKEKIKIYNPKEKTLLPIIGTIPMANEILESHEFYEFWSGHNSSIILQSYYKGKLYHYDGKELRDTGIKTSKTDYCRNIREPNSISYWKENKNSTEIITYNAITKKSTSRKFKGTRYSKIYMKNDTTHLLIKPFVNLDNIENRLLLSANYDTIYESKEIILNGAYFKESLILQTPTELLQYDHSSEELRDISSELGLSFEDGGMVSVHINQDNIWLNSRRGLYKINRVQPLFKTIINGVPKSTREMVNLNNGKIIVCSDNGMYIIDLTEGREDHLLKEGNSYSISALDEYRYIVSTYGNILYIWDIRDPNTVQEILPKYSNPDLVGSNNPLTFNHIDKNNNIFFFSKNRILRYDLQKNTLVDLPTQGVLSDFHMGVDHPNDNNKIFITSENGLYELNSETNEIRNFEALNKIVTTSIAADKAEEDIYWIGTRYSGLIKWKYNGDILKQYLEEDGLGHNNAHASLQDTTGKIWVSTDGGLSILDPETDNINTLTIQNGLHENEFNRNSFLSIGDSIFVFGGINGITYFRPNQANTTSSRNPTNIIGYSFTDNKTGESIEKSISQSNSSEIKIYPNQLHYKLKVSEIANTSSQTLRYIIAGIDSDWAFSQNNTIPIDDLEEGSNELLISRQLGINKWSPTKTITLIRPTPFYKNLWFYILSVVGSLLIAILYLNYKRQAARKQYLIIQKEIYDKTHELRAQYEKLEKSQSLNERLFTIIGHDLRSPMISLSGVGKSLDYLSKKNDKEGVKRLMNVIQTNAQTSLEIIDRLLDWNQLKRSETFVSVLIDLNKTIKDAIEYNRDRAITKDIKFEINLDQKTQLYSDQESLSIILRNLISNAVKFSHRSGTIRIATISGIDDHQITIADQGVGINPELAQELNHRKRIRPNMGTAEEQGLGMGLTMCYELAENINSQISLSPNTPCGTKVMVTISSNPNLVPMTNS